MSLRTHLSLACLGVALCASDSIFAQAIAAPSPTHQTSQDATIATPEVTKRLDGRLFYSAQERLRLDNARRRGLPVGDIGSSFQAPPSILNGFVKRGDGSTAVWVDGNVRWNTDGKNAANLVPSDVGGAAEYVKATGTRALPPLPAGRVKKVVKPRVATVQKPRLLP